jgi:hypothetical protein
MTKSILTFLVLSILTCNYTYGQSKSELKKQIEDLKKQVTQKDKEKEAIEKEKETVKNRLDRISETEIDKVISADKLPQSIVIGDAGWRIELNALKYKSDFIGQLGTIWVMDSTNLLQPQGAILLSDYKIDPILTNSEKDVIYKSFVSKGTKVEGDGGTPFAKLAATIQNNQYSRFTISLEGTSNIKIQMPDLQKISLLANQLFDMKGIKGVYICTGMHVVKYHSTKYSKSDGIAKITSPVVNIGGEFYAESSEENTEYFVARQLTQLNKQANKPITTINNELTTLTTTKSETQINIESKKYSPEQILTFLLGRKPTFDELVEFQSEPDKFFDKVKSTKEISDKENLLFENAKLKLNDLPNEIKSIDKLK